MSSVEELSFIHTYTHSPSLTVADDGLLPRCRHLCVSGAEHASCVLVLSSFRHILHWRIVSGSFWITGVPLAFVPSLLPRWRFMFSQLYLFLLYVCYWMYLFMYLAYVLYCLCVGLSLFQLYFIFLQCCICVEPAMYFIFCISY